LAGGCSGNRQEKYTLMASFLIEWEKRYNLGGGLECSDFHYSEMSVMIFITFK
jgi:hypothetical protein